MSRASRSGVYGHDRRGIAVSAVLCVVVALIILVLLVAALLSRSRRSSVEQPQAAPVGAVAPAPIHAQPASRPSAPAVSKAAAAAAAAQFSDAELSVRLHSENAALVRARVIAAQNDPQVAALIADSEEKDSALRTGIDAHPDIVEWAVQRDAIALALSDVSMHIQALSSHLQRHGKPAAAAAAAAAAVPPGDAAAETISPVKGCEYCTKDFDAFAAGDKAVIGGLQKEFSTLDAQRLDLNRKLRLHAIEREAIEDRLRSSDPEISRLAHAAAEADKAGRDSLAANPAVATPTTWLAALRAERAKRRAAIIDADVARAASRTNRNGAAVPTQTNGSPSTLGNQ